MEPDGAWRAGPGDGGGGGGGATTLRDMHATAGSGGCWGGEAAGRLACAALRISSPSFAHCVADAAGVSSPSQLFSVYPRVPAAARSAEVRSLQSLSLPRATLDGAVAAAGVAAADAPDGAAPGFPSPFFGAVSVAIAFSTSLLTGAEDWATASSTRWASATLSFCIVAASVASAPAPPLPPFGAVDPGSSIDGKSGACFAEEVNGGESGSSESEASAHAFFFFGAIVASWPDGTHSHTPRHAQRRRWQAFRAQPRSKLHVILAPLPWRQPANAAVELLCRCLRSNVSAQSADFVCGVRALSQSCGALAAPKMQGAVAAAPSHSTF